jgi:hypothetical protein
MPIPCPVGRSVRKPDLSFRVCRTARILGLPWSSFSLKSSGSWPPASAISSTNCSLMKSNRRLASRGSNQKFRRSRQVFPCRIAYSPTVLIRSVQTTGRQAALLGSVLMMVLSTLGYASVLHAAFQDMRGRPVRLADSLNVALARFLPLIGLALLFGFLVTLGLVLLIVPGLIVYTMWFVAVPACVVERCGPRASLRRSQELTKGHRWKLFAFNPSNLRGELRHFTDRVLVGCPGRSHRGESAANGFGREPGPPWASASSPIVDLRVIKEGLDIDEIGAVFD